MVLGGGEQGFVEINIVDGSVAASFTAAVTSAPGPAVLLDDLLAALEGATPPISTDWQGSADLTLSIDVPGDLLSLAGPAPRAEVSMADVFDVASAVVDTYDVDELDYFRQLSLSLDLDRVFTRLRVARDP